MNALINWFQSKNMSSRRIAALVISAATIYANSTTVSTAVNGLAGGHVKLVVELVALIIALSKLSHSTDHPATVQL